MKKNEILDLINGIKNGSITDEEAIENLKNYPFDNIGCAKIDRQRIIRSGASEVIYGAGKSTLEIIKITKNLSKYKANILITRTNFKTFQALKKEIQNAKFNEKAGIINITFTQPQFTDSYIAIVAAGTSDLAVAQEAYETATFFGNSTKLIVDVGVAGINRLFLHLEELQKAKVIIAIAGMEGALPSVVAGLVSVPVIAVPTSVGYGASFGGMAALLAMLNSCANGITVVNIDNGYGAAYSASLINHI
ncbi:nickel pincer cofactor biosynthesis protein LarB [Campylobacter geochelonis]|uniref:nickel pincer cofactor biosynthesis protein LarB n=1 Tax=Campylobacter geochelonis TaxID=1780362 RepID=UPI000770A36C|nr:nickel pincer cofactor biosynthesis protein LarB [Campylobacter geochelonis]CZE46347.1 ncair mutase [Campylobacter geochelonis]